MSTDNICFHGEIRKHLVNTQSYLVLCWVPAKKKLRRQGLYNSINVYSDCRMCIFFSFLFPAKLFVCVGYNFYSVLLFAFYGEWPIFLRKIILNENIYLPFHWRLLRKNIINLFHI